MKIVLGILMVLSVTNLGIGIVGLSESETEHSEARIKSENVRERFGVGDITIWKTNRKLNGRILQDGELELTKDFVYYYSTNGKVEIYPRDFLEIRLLHPVGPNLVGSTKEK